MRELNVRIKFVKHSLGNVKEAKTGRFRFARNPNGRVLFLGTWHAANMRFAAKVLGRHQDEVLKIVWDIAVEGTVARDCWYRRYYPIAGGRERYALHEAFLPDQVIGINCVVPTAITDDDLWRLMQIAGQYKGLSPARPGDFGQFEVQSIRPRRANLAEAEDEGLKRLTPESSELSGVSEHR